MSDAWNALKANLVASRELTKLAREKEEAVMKEWDNFHDYAGAREYSDTWYNLLQDRKEELAAAVEFRRLRAERAREARVSREALEKARRLREAKEKEAVRIQAELERARAEENVALSRGKPARGPAKPPVKETQSSRQKNRQRSVSRRRPSRGPQSSRPYTPEEVARPPRALSSGRRLPGEPRQPRQPRQPRRCFFCGRPNVRNPATYPGAQQHDPLNPWYYQQRYQQNY